MSWGAKKSKKRRFSGQKPAKTAQNGWGSWIRRWGGRVERPTSRERAPTRRNNSIPRTERRGRYDRPLQANNGGYRPRLLRAPPQQKRVDLPTNERNGIGRRLSRNARGERARKGVSLDTGHTHTNARTAGRFGRVPCSPCTVRRGRGQARKAVQAGPLCGPVPFCGNEGALFARRREPSERRRGAR